VETNDAPKQQTIIMSVVEATMQGKWALFMVDGVEKKQRLQ
jgi:hypothetical protein